MLGAQWESRVDNREGSPLRILWKKGICPVEKERNSIFSLGIVRAKIAKEAASTWPVWGGV